MCPVDKIYGPSVEHSLRSYCRRVNKVALRPMLGEGQGAEEAGAFFDEEELIGGEVFESFEEAGGPADFEEIDLFGFADAEVDTEIVPGRNLRRGASVIRCVPRKRSAPVRTQGRCRASRQGTPDAKGAKARPYMDRGHEVSCPYGEEERRRPHLGGSFGPGKSFGMPRPTSSG